MDTIRALVADRAAPGHLSIQDVPAPVPHADEVLVAVEAVSLNRGEVTRLQAAEPGWRPGWDLAGIVVRSAADRSGPPAGTRVVGLADGGAWAEQVAVATDRLAQLPDAVSFAAAATLPVAGLTALRTLELADRLDDQSVLITGASGGVGRFAVQLAAHYGADVTALVSSDGRGRPLLELGAARFAVGPPGDGPFDLILESIGGPTLAHALTSVAAGGLIVSYGNSSRQPTTFDPSSFYRRAGAQLHAFVVFADLERNGSGSWDLGRLVAMVQEGHLDVGIDREESWRDAASVVEAFVQRQVTGKAVLLID